MSNELLKYASLLVKRIHDFGVSKMYPEKSSDEIHWIHTVFWNQASMYSKSSKFFLATQFYRFSMEIYHFIPSSVETL
jgi:hypothetical protein